MIFHALGAYIILLDYDFEFPQPCINTDTPQQMLPSVWMRSALFAAAVFVTMVTQNDPAEADSMHRRSLGASRLESDRIFLKQAAQPLFQ